MPLRTKKIGFQISKMSTLIIVHALLQNIYLYYPCTMFAFSSDIQLTDFNNMINNYTINQFNKEVGVALVI